MTNQPFIKANYPHHEGVWGWGDIGDQVILVVSNIYKVMIEYRECAATRRATTSSSRLDLRSDNSRRVPRVLFASIADDILWVRVSTRWLRLGL